MSINMNGNHRKPQGCQPPTSSNIENWWERDDKWRHNDHGTWHHLCKKLREKDVLAIVTFDQPSPQGRLGTRQTFELIGLSPTDHIIAYITMAYQSCEETFDVNSKKTQTTQSIWKKLIVWKSIL